MTCMTVLEPSHRVSPDPKYLTVEWGRAAPEQQNVEILFEHNALSTFFGGSRKRMKTQISWHKFIWCSFKPDGFITFDFSEC